MKIHEYVQAYKESYDKEIMDVLDIAVSSLIQKLIPTNDTTNNYQKELYDDIINDSVFTFFNGHWNNDMEILNILLIAYDMTLSEIDRKLLIKKINNETKKGR